MFLIATNHDKKTISKSNPKQKYLLEKATHFQRQNFFKKKVTRVLNCNDDR